MRWWCHGCWSWAKQSSASTSTSEMLATLLMANTTSVPSFSCSVFFFAVFIYFSFDFSISEYSHIFVALIVLYCRTIHSRLCVSYNSLHESFPVTYIVAFIPLFVDCLWLLFDVPNSIFVEYYVENVSNSISIVFVAVHYITDLLIVMPSVAETTEHYPAMYYIATSISTNQVYLKSAAHMRSSFQVFLSCLILKSYCIVHCSACVVFLLNMHRS